MQLRDRILQGGMYLVLREGFGVILSVFGVVILARLIGPRQYGLYAGGYSIVVLVCVIGNLGVSTFLTRREETPPARMYHEAFTVLLAMSALAVMVLAALTAVFRGRLMNADWSTVIYLLLPSIPMTLLAAPAGAQLSRDLRFRAIALIDLSGRSVFYLIALPLAAFGAGWQAPALGYLGWQALSWVATSWQARYLPRLAWSRAGVRELMGYGLGYSTSIWVWQFRMLVNTLVVGRFVGPEGIGYVNLAIRVAEVLCVVKNVAWSMAIAALARVQTELPRLKRGMEEAMTIQGLGVGAPLAGFALFAPFFASRVFGAEWDSAFRVFPFIALSYLVNATFSMHSAALYVLGRNLQVTVFHLVHVALFIGSSLVLVPRFGVIGYGWAEVAGLLAYPVIHYYVSRVFPVSYRAVAPWVLVAIPPFFAVFLPPPVRLLTVLPALCLLLFSGRQRRQIGEYLGEVRRWREAA